MNKVWIGLYSFVAGIYAGQIGGYICPKFIDREHSLIIPVLFVLIYLALAVRVATRKNE